MITILPPSMLLQVLKMMVGSNLKDTQLQQIVDKTILFADKDEDGKIGFDEFCGVSLRPPASVFLFHHVRLPIPSRPSPYSITSVSLFHRVRLPIPSRPSLFSITPAFPKRRGLMDVIYVISLR